MEADAKLEVCSINAGHIQLSAIFQNKLAERLAENIRIKKDCRIIIEYNAAVEKVRFKAENISTQSDWDSFLGDSDPLRCEIHPERKQPAACDNQGQTDRPGFPDV